MPCVPACTAADELADAETQLCAAEEAAVVLDGVFLHQAAAVVFYPAFTVIRFIVVKW